MTSALGIGGSVSTIYNLLVHFAFMTVLPSTSFTRAPLLSKVTEVPFSPSLETDIRFDLNSGVYSAFSNVMLSLVLFIMVWILAFPFPITLNVDSFPAANLVIGRCRSSRFMKEALSTKQWSDAPESIKVGTSDGLF